MLCSVLEPSRRLRVHLRIINTGIQLGRIRVGQIEPIISSPPRSPFCVAEFSFKSEPIGKPKHSDVNPPVVGNARLVPNKHLLPLFFILDYVGHSQSISFMIRSASVEHNC